MSKYRNIAIIGAFCALIFAVFLMADPSYADSPGDHANTLLGKLLYWLGGLCLAPLILRALWIDFLAGVQSKENSEYWEWNREEEKYNIKLVPIIKNTLGNIYVNASAAIGVGFLLIGNFWEWLWS